MATFAGAPVSRRSVPRAHAARRGAIADAGLVAAIGPHMAVSGGLDITAPALWMMLIGAVAILGARTAAFGRCAWPVTLALVVGIQFAMRMGMVKAPWTLGLRIHHEATLITPSATVTHLMAATIVLVAAICRPDRLLCVLSRVVHAVPGAAPRPRAPAHLAARIAVAPPPPRMRAAGLRRATPSRGPPLPV